MTAYCAYGEQIVTEFSNNPLHQLTKTLTHCVSKNDPTLKRYSSKLYGSILMILGKHIHTML